MTAARKAKPSKNPVAKPKFEVVSPQAPAPKTKNPRRRRKRHNPKAYVRNVRNTLIGAGIGAVINYAWKYWVSPPGVLVPMSEGSPLRNSAFYTEVLLPGAVIGGIAGMAYTGATK